jgi:ectoine hydroxylase-related dioxygenase (phytanoyl-CoA dioxygenase family)
MKLSPQELKRGKLTKKKLDHCVTEIDTEGYAILEGVVPTSLLREIRGAMDPLHQQHFRSHRTATKRPHAFGKGHGIFGVRAPKEVPFLDPRVVTNGFAVQILDEVLGTDFFCASYNTNNSWPGSRAQHVHRDHDPLFENLPHPLPPSGLTASIPLVPFTEKTGATEIWPGTHLYPGPYPGGVRNFDSIAGDRPSRRMLAPLGSIVLRDGRMWHRGMPNKTTKVRTMLSLVYRRAFHGQHQLMGIRQEVWNDIPEKTRQVFRFSSVND